MAFGRLPPPPDGHRAADACSDRRRPELVLDRDRPQLPDRSTTGGQQIALGEASPRAAGREGERRIVSGYRAGAMTPPLVRQLVHDHLGLGRAARSQRSERLMPRTATADRVVQSVCPFCAVGCGQRIFVKDEQVVHVEGDHDSPISRGRLCSRGSSSLSLVTSPLRETKVRYRRPHATDWEDLELDTAMDMIADRVIDTRRRTWQQTNDDGARVSRTLGFAHLGGATLDNEENYLIKKCFSALGAVAIENQARI
jgi:formate dehydrogenase major subunit